MAYGAVIYDPAGNDFVSLFAPFNIIDSFYLTSSGSKAYTLSAGESLAVVDMNPYYSNGACCSVTISGGTVSWVNKSNTTGLGSTSVVAVQGSKICVVKKR